MTNQTQSPEPDNHDVSDSTPTESLAHHLTDEILDTPVVQFINQEMDHLDELAEHLLHPLHHEDTPATPLKDQPQK